MGFESLTKKIEARLGSDELFELTINDVVNDEFIFEKTEILTPISNKEVSFLLRVTNKRTGGSGVVSFNNISKADYFIDLARKISKKDKNENFKDLKIPKSKKVVLNSSKIKNLELGNIIGLVKELNKSFDNVSFKETFLSKTSFKNLFINSYSDDFISYEKSSFNYATDLEFKGLSFWDSWSYQKDYDFGLDLKNFVNHLQDYSKTASVGSGKIPVIFGFSPLRDLFSSTFFQRINGYEYFMKRTSYEKNESVMSSRLSIFNDSSISFGSSSRPFDGEGSVSKKTLLIDKGVCKNFLTDIYTSGLINQENTSSCEGISSRPNIGFSNFVVKKGLKNFNSLVNGFSKVLFVEDISGAHMINPTSGDFSTEARKVLLYEKGVLSGRLDKAVLSGNFYDLLNNVAGVQNQQRSNEGFIIPNICFDQVNFFS